MSINYYCYDIETNGMKVFSLDFNNLISCLPSDRKCRIKTNIKTHCWDDSNEFIISVNKGKINDCSILKEINEYLQKNNARSFFFEGLISRGNNNYELIWGS